MVDMITQHVVPSCEKAGIDTTTLKANTGEISTSLIEMEAAEDEYKKATLARVLRLEVHAYAAHALP